MSRKVKITLKKSPIGSKKNHKDTIRGLGLRRLNKSSILDYTPEVAGMVKSVSHLVEVEEV